MMDRDGMPAVGHVVLETSQFAEARKSVHGGEQEWQQRVCEEAEVLGASITRCGFNGEKYKQRLSLLATIL